jgi:hypothetical protein
VFVAVLEEGKHSSVVRVAFLGTKIVAPAVHLVHWGPRDLLLQSSLMVAFTALTLLLVPNHNKNKHTVNSAHYIPYDKTCDTATATYFMPPKMRISRTNPCGP